MHNIFLIFKNKLAAILHAFRKSPAPILTIDDHVNKLQENGFQIIRPGECVGHDAYLDKEEFRYILWIDRIYSKIQNVPGHIVEVGVARGRNSVLFGNLIKLSGEETIRNYYGFDTFSGYTESDIDSSPHLSKNDWREISLSFVKNRLERNQLGSTCFVFEGDIKDIAENFVASGHNKFQPGHLQIALLYIDCNSYAAAKYSMDFFYDYISPGGLVCIDEKLQGGETRALRDFCSDQGLKFIKDSGPFSLPAYTKKEVMG